ncbi:MAG: hypothetical protein HC769_06340 [Cyanobacteria bacterium CRU_2_1]|nr:hypothetical protein [Cyanobacteria bacterium RU_5_0]NJR58501.1 hypothetical protein [Cyanobacteria bacterium CRU_2_1]
MSEETITHLAVNQPRVEALQDTNSLSPVNGDGSGNNLDKIKELLFGVQTREYEKRFARLEERLSRECVSLREETRNQLDAIEQHVRQSIDALAADLKTEQTQRNEALRGLDEGFKTAARSLKKHIDQLEEQTSQRQRELRQQFLEQSKTLDDEIRQKYQEILTILERRTQEIQTEKADRSALASLFRELANRVNNQDIPGNP